MTARSRTVRDNMAKLTGGYLINTVPLMRSGTNAHTSAVERAVAQCDLDAVNAIQATPWRVNTWLLDVMLEAWANGQRVGGLEVNEPHSIPRIDNDVWDGMAPEDKTEHRKNLHRLHSENASIMGRSTAVLNCLTVADELRDRPAIWYPHVMDFRGRIYPSSTLGPHPQGSDIAKSLIMFAEGRELGPDGEFWLCVRAAGCAGQDKLPLADRVKWVADHSQEIARCWMAPLSPEAVAFWGAMDEPWGFLATCHELTLAWQLDDPSAFVSHLPVPLDGSCNGLQHLSAMGLDPVGAAATNLANGPRQDIYLRVAARVAELVEADVLAGIDEARVWHGKINRKTVKRAVMTTPYGVTDRGIRDQLIYDGHVPEDDGIGSGAAADYLKDKLVQALGDTVVAAKSIMAWLQVVADRLAKAGLGFRWTTPTGSVVEQSYHALVATRIDTLCGELSLVNEAKSGGLNVRKQALGSAPNVIHSFDAAHLRMTVLAGAERGIGSWAMIHDSFGTHACHTTKLNAILREQFVAIYQEDWLRRIYNEVRSYAPHVQIEPPPARGSFDINEVLDAEFFFS